MNISNMTDSQKFILLAICFLIPVSAFILNWILYFIGKYFWNWYTPKLRRNSKLRLRLIQNNDNSFVYVETGMGIVSIIFLIIFLVIYMFTSII
jgi:hypothetical protein